MKGSLGALEAHLSPVRHGLELHRVAAVGLEALELHGGSGLRWPQPSPAQQRQRQRQTEH